MSNKDEDFRMEVMKRRAKREVRDDVFIDILNSSLFQQREKLRNWIYEQILESKFICKGLEPCAADNVGRGVLEFANERLESHNKSFNTVLLKLGAMTEEERKELEKEINSTSTVDVSLEQPNEHMESSASEQEKELTVQEVQLQAERMMSDIEKAFHGMNSLVIPIVRELLYLRRLLDFLYDVTP